MSVGGGDVVWRTIAVLLKGSLCRHLRQLRGKVLSGTRCQEVLRFGVLTLVRIFTGVIDLLGAGCTGTFFLANCCADTLRPLPLDVMNNCSCSENIRAFPGMTCVIPPLRCRHHLLHVPGGICSNEVPGVERNGICCEAQCGTCGGLGCGRRPGGPVR